MNSMRLPNRVLILLVLACVVLLSGKAASANAAAASLITITPQDGATDIAASAEITITFQKAVRLANGTALTSRNAESVIDFKKVGGGTVPATISWSPTKKKITIKPKNTLAYDTRYTVRIPEGKVKDAQGSLNKAVEAGFKTEKAEAPYQVAFTPAKGAANIATDSAIKLVLNKQVKLAGGKPITKDAVERICKLTDNQQKKVTFAGNWDESTRTITIRPDGNLQNAMTYTVTLLENKVIDKQGNKNPAISSTFTTVAFKDDIPPTVTVTPAHGAQKVALTSNVTLQFAEDVVAKDGSVLSSNTVADLVKWYDSKGNPVSCTATWNKSKRTITLRVKGKLLKNTTYFVDLPANAVKDLAGNGNNHVFVSFFTNAR